VQFLHPVPPFFLRSEDVINRTEAGMTWMEKTEDFLPHIYSFVSLVVRPG